MPTQEITTEQLVLLHIDGQPVSGVIIQCDGDSQQATVRARIDGQFQIVTTSYADVEVR